MTDVSERSSAGAACDSIFWVRCSLQGSVTAIASLVSGLKRGDRIICRTQRGLEIGTVLSEAPNLEFDASIGRSVRRADAADELLWQALQDLCQSATLAWQAQLASWDRDAVLLEVEPLLDGRTLIFHFLETPSEEVERHKDAWLEAYRERVRESPFVQRVEQGCGPGCGTEAKAGCGSKGGCATCSAAKHCAR